LKIGPRNYISILKKYGDLQFSDNSFSELIINAGLVISNSSSTCIESLALGVPVIILQGGSPINQNPIPNSIDKNMWDECDNNVDFYNAFKRLFIEKNILAQSKAAKLIRKKYFEPVSTKSINEFLEIDIL
jgi:predicted glycosyltransferase